MQFWRAVHLAEAPSRWLQGHQLPSSQPPAPDYHDCDPGHVRDNHDYDRGHVCDNHDHNHVCDGSNANENKLLGNLYLYTHVLFTDWRSNPFIRQFTKSSKKTSPKSVASKEKPRGAKKKGDLLGGTFTWSLFTSLLVFWCSCETISHYISRETRLVGWSLKAQLALELKCPLAG